MEDAERSPRSINYAFDVIRQVYNFANRNNFIDCKSPTLGIKKPKKDNKRYRYLSVDEANLLLNELKIKYPLVYEISIISLQTGLRAGEIFALKWSDIDFDNRFIQVRRSCRKGLVSLPKNGKGRRVDMTPHLAETLKAYKTQQKRNAFQRGERL